MPPPVECGEWGGWVWAVLAGPGVAPPLRDWIGPEITADLGVYRMEDMELHDKLVWELPANWKVVIDGFNENYHAAHLHTISPQDVKDGRFSYVFRFRAEWDDGHSVQGRATRADADRRPPEPGDLPLHDLPYLGVQQQSQPPPALPIRAAGGRPHSLRGVELWYKDGDDEYLEKVGAHWERLKGRRSGRRGHLPGVGGSKPINGLHAQHLQQPRVQDHPLPPSRARHARRRLRRDPHGCPHYVAGIDFNPAVRQDAFDVMARLLEHYRNKSTDQVPEQWHEPVQAYRDEQLWEREMAVVHGKVPLPLALSCELPDPGTYKAIDVAGTPVLITRDSAGEVHAMVNVCRHRGSEIIGEGTGKAHRLTCPYHSWSYDLKGCLLSVYGEDTFGGVDKDSMSLRALPAAERAGLVFVSLDPTATIDLDEWLGPELIMLLEAMALDRCYHYSTRTLDGPNWKVVIDGYLEGYHFASLHRTTVYRTNFSNMAAFDSWGPHQRNAFCVTPDRKRG